MARESPYFREILCNLLEQFEHKNNISVEEYAEYLRKNRQTVAKLIKQGQLPGKAVGSKENPSYIIPVHAIALSEIHAANIK